MITQADIDRAEDMGTTPDHEARRREAKEAYDAAWCAFEAYVSRPDHDVTGDEYERVHGAYLDARKAYDAACRQVPA
jgi:hypothetical protein